MLDKNEVLQKEIDWIKLSMDTDKHDHSNLTITRLQIGTIFIAIFGVITTILIPTSLYPYIWTFFCVLLCFTFFSYWLYEMYKPNGLKNMQCEFRIKKFLIRKRYEQMNFSPLKKEEGILKVDLKKIQGEFDELKNLLC